jgi:hypothetical protein
MTTVCFRALNVWQGVIDTQFEVYLVEVCLWSVVAVAKSWLAHATAASQLRTSPGLFPNVMAENQPCYTNSMKYIYNSKGSKSASKLGSRMNVAVCEGRMWSSWAGA